MKEKILPFIKKYPMSILLAIIAIQLINVSGKLDQSGRYDGDKRACIRWLVYYDVATREKEEKEQKRAAAKIGVPLDMVSSYCSRLMRFH